MAGGGGGPREAMEALTEIIAGVEGKFGRSAISAHPLAWRIREETVTTHSQRRGCQGA